MYICFLVMDWFKPFLWNLIWCFLLISTFIFWVYPSFHISFTYVHFCAYLFNFFIAPSATLTNNDNGLLYIVFFFNLVLRNFEFHVFSYSSLFEVLSKRHFPILLLLLTEKLFDDNALKSSSTGAIHIKNKRRQNSNAAATQAHAKIASQFPLMTISSWSEFTMWSMWRHKITTEKRRTEIVTRNWQ